MDRSVRGFLLALLLAASGCASRPGAADLPSWREGPSKDAIVAFVERVTDPRSADFVPGPERIAVFDNDGTLWVEKPFYTQLRFALDRVQELAPRHPEWKEQEPFRSVLAGDLKRVAAGGEKALLEIVAATHAGGTPDEFRSEVERWLAEARHPRFDRPYPELVYQPMLELLAYLRAHGFQTWIVSGGGVEFMRPWTERVYGIPPQQVVGSQFELRCEWRDGTPTLVTEPKIAFLDDKAGKPVAIHRSIGRRPIFAGGNSDGDREMLLWTKAGAGARFALVVHHTDAEREWAYDRESHVGRLDKVLSEAKERDIVVVDMARDWKRVFR